MLMVRKAISYAKKHAVSDEQALAVMEPKHNFDSRIYTLIGYLELMAVGVLGTDLYVIGVPFLSDLTTSKPPMR